MSIRENGNKNYSLENLKDVYQGIDRYVMRTMQRSVRGQLGRRLPGEVVMAAGRSTYSDYAEGLCFKVMSFLYGIASAKDSVRLPVTNLEREVFARMLVDQVTIGGDALNFIAPVCPDYGGGESFYQRIGGGISPEARGAMQAVSYLQALLKASSIEANFQVLVADTEDDIQEIISRTAEGSVEGYKGSCQESVEEISRSFFGVSQTKVSTFSEFLGNKFRVTQYVYEERIRQKMSEDIAFAEEVAGISIKRADRHRQILGRDERNCELSVRYMSQYAALGSIARGMGTPVVFLNYETPNRAYFNAYQYKKIGLIDQDERIVPVVGTVVVRGG